MMTALWIGLGIVVGIVTTLGTLWYMFIRDDGYRW